MVVKHLQLNCRARGYSSFYEKGTNCPVYKAGGKDPLEADSYRGITLTSVWAKLLESPIVQRLVPLMDDLCLSHVNQTGYRRGNYAGLII